MKKLLVIPLLMSVAACGTTGKLNWTSAPRDQQVYDVVFRSCLKLSKPAKQVHFNDQKETVTECAEVARTASQFCPPNQACTPDIASHQNVRNILLNKREEMYNGGY